MPTVEDGGIQKTTFPVLVDELLPTAVRQLLSQQLGSEVGFVELALERVGLIELQSCMRVKLPLSSK
jgi:hypothetical protein